MWHWAVVVVAYSVVSAHWLLNAIALLFLTISYWCVYEIGYQENDTVGEKFERKPKLSENYDSHGDRLTLQGSPWPWIWGFGLALPGCGLLVMSRIEGPLMQSVGVDSISALWQQLWPQLAISVALWMVYLVAIRGAFWVYNQFNEESRMWIYPLLQTQRLFGFTLLIHTTPVGFVLLMSLAISRWLQYCIYRCGGNRWKFPVNMSYLLLFVMLFLAVMLSHPEPMTMLGWHAAIAAAFCIFKSVRKAAEVTASFHLLADV